MPIGIDIDLSLSVYTSSFCAENKFPYYRLYLGSTEGGLCREVRLQGVLRMGWNDHGHVSASPPGDFEEHAALIVGMTEMLALSAPTVYQLMRPLVDRIAIVAIVQGEEQRRQAITLLTDWGVPAGSIFFAFMPVGCWVRDFAPSFVRCFDGTVVTLEAEYRFEGRTNECVVPAALASLLRLPRRKVPLVLEGGNLLSNGWGLALTTSALLECNRLNGRHYTPEQAMGLLMEHYGFEQVAMLEPLIGYRTLHVDMFATFVGHDSVVVAACDPRVDPPSAGVLDRNAQRLGQIRTRGRALKVTRIPMPAYVPGRCRTYTNVIYANGLLLVPHYPDVDAGIEREVLATYRALLPDWKIQSVDCDALITGGGALRCCSAHVPMWLADRFRDTCESPDNSLLLDCSGK
ncbi:MAG: Porphyromonas-type peptidyl-arginine deiminase [Phycisphaerales bacterium]|nr:Porphyromonas-type peptidyl-arginine deiminase [Phycisphaerales bacterium]